MYIGGRPDACILPISLPRCPEIGGGWCVWQGIRNAKPWWYILLGEALRREVQAHTL